MGSIEVQAYIFTIKDVTALRRQERKLFIMIVSMFCLLGTVQPAFGMGSATVATDQAQYPTSKVSTTTSMDPAAFAPNRVIVKYKSSTKSHESLLSAMKDKIVSVKPLSLIQAEVWNLSGGADVKSVVEELSANPDVLYAEPDYYVQSPNIKSDNIKNKVDYLHSPETIKAVEVNQAITKYAKEYNNAPDPITPNDPLYQDQWSLNNQGQTLNGNAPGGTPDIDMDAPEAWALTKGSNDLIVALIGSGVDTNLPDLKDNIWINAKEIAGNRADDDGNGVVDDVYGWDFFHNDNTLFDTSDKYTDYAGTWLASIIAAKMNNTGITGIAPNVKVMPLKFVTDEQGGTIEDAIKAIEYAQNKGAKIAVFGATSSYYSESLREAVKNSSMLFVTGAGDQFYHDRANTDIFPTYPGSFKFGNVLNVTAVDRGGNLAEFAGYGKQSVDVAAPGDYVAAASPDQRIGFAAEINNGTYKAIYNGMGFEQVPIKGFNADDPKIVYDPKQRQDMFDTAMNYLNQDRDGNGKTDILLVQDNITGNFGIGPFSTSAANVSVTGLVYDEDGVDETTRVKNVYKNLLHDGGYDGYSLFETDTQAQVGPDLATLNKYDVVIWSTGTLETENPNFLLDSDQRNLTAYLNGGGHLLLSGQNAIDHIKDSDFVTKTLHLVQQGQTGFDHDTGTILPVENTIYDYRTKPGIQPYYLTSINAFFDLTVSSDPSITKINLEYPEGYYRYKTGTPFAAANAAGVAALVWSYNPSMSAGEVKSRLMNSGTPLSSLSNITVSGRMINAFRALWDTDIPGTPLQDSMTSGTLDSNGKTFGAGNRKNAVYALDLKAGETITLSLSGGATIDFDLALFGPAATTISTKNGLVGVSKSPGSSKEEIVYTVPAAGTYYVNVMATAGSGSYKLSVTTGNQWGTFQDSNPALRFNGNWSTLSDSPFSGGTIKQIQSEGSVEFGFKGNLIEWIGTKNPSQGIADVYIDDVKVASPSLYSTTVLHHQSLFKKWLPAGRHTIKIQWTGQHDSAAKGSWINVDAFVVSNLIASSDINVSYNGAWGTMFGSRFTKGNERFTSSKNSAAEFVFTGTRVTLMSNTGSNRGKAQIFIDGNPVKTVDLYSMSIQYQVPVFTSDKLNWGIHTIKVVNIGDRNASSSGQIVTIDAINVLN
ncbi:S8 family serine peptidase [Paenibacillus sp. Soil724D2]|uniref:S8 family serine peptidase n=1 Tax=Paenibacillus sp. (strain Soil724D2) TaxID=1736392 RepID=UPI000712D885|nr:S8 family serine peptidase [Paenibacillus sp. Soil724D2]KRE36265.1 hypothetical protein ASG85_08760 [Paenibacillus sp. Soil724D2]